MLGRQPCRVSGRFRFLLSRRSSRHHSSQYFSKTNADNDSLPRQESNIFNQKTSDIFQAAKDGHTSRSLSANISSHLSANEGALNGSNISFLYRSAASVGHTFDPNCVKQILHAARHKDNVVHFSADEIKDILHGHRYTNDKNKDVRVLLWNVLPKWPEQSTLFESQRKLGLSLFGLQNMTATHYEIRSILSTLTHHLQRCPEAVDGSCVSAALHGTRMMNSSAGEVLQFLRVITQKLTEYDFALSPGGLSQSINSLIMKSDKKPDILHLLAALNTRLERVSNDMSAAEVCRALNGLQSMSAQSSVVVRTLQLLTARLMAPEVQRDLAGRDFALALGGLKTMGCATQETNLLMNTLADGMKRLNSPMAPKDLVVAFSGLKSMRSSQAGVSSVLSALTSNMLLLQRGGTAVPRFLLPNMLRYMKQMSSDGIVVRNFLSMATDLFSAEEKPRLTAAELSMCLSGMVEMQSSEPTVRRLLSYITRSFLQSPPREQVLNWAQICLMLKGMSSMSNDSEEVRGILALLAKNVQRLHSTRAPDGDQSVNALSSAMYSMRNMLELSSHEPSQEHLRLIYLVLFETVKKRSAESHQGVGKKTLLATMGSLTALPSSDPAVEEVMWFLVDLIKTNKNAVMATPFGHEVSQCLRGISCRPHSCQAADTLLRAFLQSISSDSIAMFETDILQSLKKMGYPRDVAVEILSSAKNKSVVNEQELTAHFKRAMLLPEVLASLQESIECCVNGDAVDIFWSSNLLQQISAHDTEKFSAADVASVVQSASQFSLLFFSKHKRIAIPLREKFLTLAASVLKDTTLAFSDKFTNFYSVLCGSECLWRQSGNVNGMPLLDLILDALEHSTFELTLSDTAQILNLLKRSAGRHSRLERLLEVVIGKIDEESDSSSRTLTSNEFASACRGLRYSLNGSPRARHLLSIFVQRAEETDLQFSRDDLILAASGLKSAHNGHPEVHSSLLLFRRQLNNFDGEGGLNLDDLSHLLSCLRHMDSSDQAVSSLALEVLGRLPDLSQVSVRQEHLCDFVEFFSNKLCADSPAIFGLRDYFQQLLSLVMKKEMGARALEHLVSMKTKRSRDGDMQTVYASITRDILSADSAQKMKITPNVICVGLLGLDVVFERDGVAEVAAFCKVMDGNMTTFTFQNLMWALSSLRSPALLPSSEAVGLVLNSLAKTPLSKTKVKFPAVLSALQSLVVLSGSSAAASQLFPAVTAALAAEETLSHHRITRLLEALQGVADLSSPELHELLELLLVRMQGCSSENYDKKATLPMVTSLEKLVLRGEELDVVQRLQREVLVQFLRSRELQEPISVQSLHDIRLCIAKEKASAEARQQS